MKPAALFTSVAKHLAQSGPEAKRTVTDGKIRGAFKTTPFEIEEQFSPTLGAFSVAVSEASYLLTTPLVRANEDQNALLFVHSRLEIHAIRPDIDNAPGAKIAFLPALVVIPPVCLEP